MVIILMSLINMHKILDKKEALKKETLLLIKEIYQLRLNGIIMDMIIPTIVMKVDCMQIITMVAELLI